MRLLSWNLFGLEDAHLDVRTEAALFIALLGGPPEQVLASPQGPKPPPDILMFQEVVDRSLLAHLTPHLTAAGYEIRHSSRDQREYYEVIAVRPPFEVAQTTVTPLDSEQGRELLMVEATCHGVRWLLMTAHLESMKTGARLRAVQSTHVLERLRDWDGPALFAGDTNLRVAEADALGPLPDAWDACGSPTRERWTRLSPTSSRRARYDRIWGHGVRFTQFQCLGRDPVTQDGDPPSDHLAIETHFRPA